MKKTKNHKNLSKTPKTTVKPKNHSNIFWIFGVFAIPADTLLYRLITPLTPSPTYY